MVGKQSIEKAARICCWEWAPTRAGDLLQAAAWLASQCSSCYLWHWGLSCVRETVWHLLADRMKRRDKEGYSGYSFWFNMYVIGGTSKAAPRDVRVDFDVDLWCRFLVEELLKPTLCVCALLCFRLPLYCQISLKDVALNLHLWHLML